MVRSLVLCLLVLPCCGPPAGAVQEDFAGALAAFGRGEAEAPADVCAALRGAFSIYFAGWVGQATIGYGPVALKGFEGRDYVWDLANHQCTVSSYRGAGGAKSGGVELSKASVSSVNGSVGASVYSGYAGGPRSVISDWNGHFGMLAGQANLSRLVPVLGALPITAGAGVTLFWAAEDLDGSGIVNPTEFARQMVGDTWNRIAGASVGPTLMAELIPSAGTLSVMEGYWSNDLEQTRAIAERDADLGARLERDDEGRAYVVYGAAEMPAVERARLMSRAIMRDWGWLDPSAHYARHHAKDLAVRRERAVERLLAQGVLADHGATLEEVCPNLR